MPTILVMHPQFKESIVEIIRRADRAINQQKGAALSIISPTGGGKSTLANFIGSLRPDVRTLEYTYRRCVSFNVPPKPSSISMSSALLEALGDPRWNRGRADELEYRATHLLIACKTEIVLIDNVHDVPERRKLKGVREVGNWVRNLIDRVPALFVSLGADQGLDVFKANNQMRRRSPAHKRIDYFECKSHPGVARMRRFLFELDKQLPLSGMSDLSLFDTTTRIWMATYGIPDYIIGLITEAMELAVQSGTESISLSNLSEAFRRLYLDAAPEENPFSPETAIRVLDHDGEPFEDWLSDGYA